MLVKESPELWRRSVYIYVKRQLLMPSMELFDAPTTTDSCPLRLQSTVPTQALVLMNDDFVEDQARYLSERATREMGAPVNKIVERLFSIVTSHFPGEARLQQALDFVKQRETQSDRSTALADLAHVLLNSSEFVYIK